MDLFAFSHDNTKIAATNKDHLALEFILIDIEDKTIYKNITLDNKFGQYIIKLFFSPNNTLVTINRFRWNLKECFSIIEHVPLSLETTIKKLLGIIALDNKN